MKRLNKFIIQTHNISGSFLSLMFVVWFLSGIVLIFDGFPHASREERFMHLPELTLQVMENLQAPSSDFNSGVTLETSGGKAVYRVSMGRKAQKVFDAETLSPLQSFTEDNARKLSESFNGHPVKQIVKKSDFDQWVPWSYYKPLLPFYKCYMSDPEHTVIYISEKTGEIVQETKRMERWSARVGAIPHWIYFKKLRLMKDVWRIVVIVLSTLGILISLSGIYVGIIRLKKRKKKSLTPYKKFWYKWHHLAGFSFGLFVFTFVLSGLISVTDVPNWMVGVRSSEKKSIEWNGKPNLTRHENKTPKEVYLALNKKVGIRKIEWVTVFGHPQFRVYYNDYQVPEVYSLNNEKIEPMNQFSPEDIKLQAEIILASNRFKLKIQRGYDNYYSASAMRYLPATAYKIAIDDEQRTNLYIDPATGDEVCRTTKNIRLRVWLYRFLHALDIPFFKNIEVLRKMILILLSVGGLIVSISGMVLSVKWFKRSFANSKNKNSNLNMK